MLLLKMCMKTIFFLYNKETNNNFSISIYRHVQKVADGEMGASLSLGIWTYVKHLLPNVNLILIVTYK